MEETDGTDISVSDLKLQFPNPRTGLASRWIGCGESIVAIITHAATCSCILIIGAGIIYDSRPCIYCLVPVCTPVRQSSQTDMGGILDTNL